MTPSPVAPEVYEISDISSSHTVDPKQDIQTSTVEENISFHPTQSFSSDSSIINFVHSLPVISPGKGEEFHLYVSNNVAGVQKGDSLDFLEEISYFRSGPFTLIDLYILTNSYIITCTNTHIFVEEGENRASTISFEHLEHVFHTLGSDMTLFGFNFKFQEPIVMLVVVLINFGVKNQAPRVSFKFVVGNSMSVSLMSLLILNFVNHWIF